MTTSRLSLSCLCLLLASVAALADGPGVGHGACMTVTHGGNFRSANFTTPWPVTVSLESRFETFLKAKYGAEPYATYCIIDDTMEKAENHLAQEWPDSIYHFIQTGWKPGADASKQAG